MTQALSRVYERSAVFRDFYVQKTHQAVIRKEYNVFMTLATVFCRALSDESKSTILWGQTKPCTVGASVDEFPSWSNPAVENN